MSRACLGPEYLTESRAWIAGRGLDWKRWAHLFDTPPERMLKTLAYLERHYYSAERYLRTMACPPAGLQRCASS